MLLSAYILNKVKLTRDISKKIYNKVTEDIFDSSNVSIFEIEKKKIVDVYTLLCLWSAKLSKAFSLRNICYSKISYIILIKTSILL